jgi:hypothetical protein
MKQRQVAENGENFTDNIPMKKPAELVQVQTVTTTPCIIRTHREVQMGKFAKPGAHIRPTICRGHHIVPKELRATLVCHHCQHKGHYARNCRTRWKEQKATPPTTIRTTIVTNMNRYKELSEEKLEESGRTAEDPLLPPSSSYLFHTNSLRCPALGNGLDLALPTSHPQGPKRHLGAKEIKELIQLNVTRYSQTERAGLAQKLRDQLKKLPRDKPIAIPDPATYVNKASLMAMEHDARLDILDKLIPDN